MRKKWYLLSFVIIFMCAIWGTEEKVWAGDLDDPYAFYLKYKNETVFIPTSDVDGEICFGTAAGSAKSTDVIKYSTVGWKVIVYDENGKEIQSVVFKRGGDFLKKKVPMKQVGEIKYNLYSISLSDIQKNLGSNANNVLKKKSSSIKLHACMVVVTNGVASGSISNDGKISGTVYMDYDSMCASAEWSSGTKEFFKSYYNKTVKGLYRTMTLTAGPGIASVLGAGSYLYGTTVEISAIPQMGYDFYFWSGTTNFDTNSTKLVMSKDYTMTAYAMVKQLVINYYSSDGKTIEKIKTYSYDDSAQKVYLPREIYGFQFGGWMDSAEGDSVVLGANAVIDNAVILAHNPVWNLYPKMNANQYSIKFCDKSSEKVILSLERSYGQYFQTPSQYVNENLELGINGWTAQYGDTINPYGLGVWVDTTQMAQALSLPNLEKVEVIMWTRWSECPEIIGENAYFTLQDAQRGAITEQVLSKYARCIDSRDGIIRYGVTDKQTFKLISYYTDKYKRLRKGCCMEESFMAINRYGSKTYCRIKVYIVDSQLPERVVLKPRKIRFVSKDYLVDASGQLAKSTEGGLQEESKWRQEQYWKLLKNALE